MNMKKLFTVLAILLITGLAFGQIVVSDDQLFGSTRTTPEAYSFDFGKITAQTVEHDFIIPNDNKVPITIIGVETPEGFQTIVVDKVIKSNNVGMIKVIVNKNKFTSTSFDEKIIVNVEYETFEGRTTTTIPLSVKGSF